MGSLLMTGFPGFLGSALLPRLLARRSEDQAICLVQAQHVPLAATRIKQIEAVHPHTRDRITVVVGDITEQGLGLDIADRARLAEVREIWHLAAVYDLSVPEDVARRVNVEGTAHVLEFAISHPTLERLNYVSTCYVSGDHPGLFAEDDLDVGQGFLNHYEATKFEAEVLVRRAMRAGLPATIFRPGVVVGDSRTGETQKYDGPYFLAAFLRRQPALAVVPAVGDPDEVRFGLVPRDYVIDAMDALSAMDKSEGRTYALTDPHPPTARTLVDAFASYLGKRVTWVPLPLGATRALLGGIPGLEKLLGLPAEGLDYFAYRTVHSTTNAVADLVGTGISCPTFTDYAGVLLDFMIAHPEYDSHAMI
ncbi:MAG: SDR family oxidoreductase [Candidatus Nanopelagicales bacterium]